MSYLNLDFDFDSLRQQHELVNRLLHSPDTKLEIIEQGHEKWACQVSEAALRMADSCAAAKDLVVLAKDHLQSLKSAFRRIPSAHDHVAGHSFEPYRVPRKQLKKAILRRLDSLQGMKTAYIVGSMTPPGEQDESLEVVVNMLREVRATTLSIVRSLMSLIAMPNPKSKQGSHKEPMFRLKLTRVDSLSFWEKCAVTDASTVAKRLEEVEVAVDDMEAELERMFRRLIRTRASLLNILTT